MNYAMPDGTSQPWPPGLEDQQRLVNRFNEEPEETTWPVDRPDEELSCLRCDHEFQAGNAPQDHQGSLCPACGSGEICLTEDEDVEPTSSTPPSRTRGGHRLSRHEKQRVRRFLRQEAGKHGRGHRGDRGSVVGTRYLIRYANHRMGRSGRCAYILYPQDQGCGLVDVRQLLEAS